MQCFDNGSSYTVTVTTREVVAFREKWPCSGLQRKPLTFGFDKKTGDLESTNDEQNHPNADGAAVVALSHDAQAYGKMRLKLA